MSESGDFHPASPGQPLPPPGTRAGEVPPPPPTHPGDLLIVEQTPVAPVADTTQMPTTPPAGTERYIAQSVSSDETASTRFGRLSRRPAGRNTDVEGARYSRRVGGVVIGLESVAVVTALTLGLSMCGGGEDDEGLIDFGEPDVAVTIPEIPGAVIQPGGEISSGDSEATPLPAEPTRRFVPQLRTTASGQEIDYLRTATGSTWEMIQDVPVEGESGSMVVRLTCRAYLGTLDPATATADEAERLSIVVSNVLTQLPTGGEGSPTFPMHYFAADPERPLTDYSAEQWGLLIRSLAEAGPAYVDGNGNEVNPFSWAINGLQDPGQLLALPSCAVEELPADQQGGG